MATRTAPERLLAVLGTSAWSTTHELASALSMSESTARKHLLDLVVMGRVEPREDPWANRGYHWRRLAQPIGEAPPTDQMLCATCAEETFRDIVRYREALRTEAFERWTEAADYIGDDESVIPPCAKCHQPIV